MALNYGEDYYPKGSILDYGEDYYPSSKVEDPNSNVTKQTTIEENSDGTKTTTTIENKTNNPKWRGENQDKVDNSPIPGNETLKGNYYDDEVALKGDSTIFDQAEFGIEPSFGDNVVIMKHPSGTTIKAYSPEEVAMYTKNGYVAPNTEMVYPEVGTGSDKEKAEFNDWIDEYNARPEMTPSQFFDNPGIDTDAMGNPIQDANFAGMTVNDGADQYADLLNIQEGIDPNDDYYEGYILGNDTLEGNYYGDEVALKGDSDIFDQENFGDVEWGGKDTTPITMYHPSGFTQVVEGEEEAALFKRDGYFSTPEEVLEDAKAEQAFKDADASQSSFNRHWDAEQNSLNNTPSWLGQAEGPLTDAERDDLIAQDQSIIPNQTFDWQGIGKGPMTDAEREDANKSLSKDHEEVNKSEVAKEVVSTFQDRVNAGANPEEEIQRFVSSSGQLKDWRPKMFKAILGTLVGIAGGKSFASAATAGFGLVGEDIAREEKVDAEIAKEDRKHKKDLELKGIEAGAKALTAKKDLLKSTTKEINTSAGNFQQEFFRSMDKDMKERLNKKIPDVTSAYKTALSAFVSRLRDLGITESDLMFGTSKQAKVSKRIFDSGMRDWMKAMRAQAQGDDDISISSSPDAFIRARTYHNKLGENRKKNGNVAPLLFDKDGNLDSEALLELRGSSESLVARSENYQNSDEVFKALLKIWRKLKDKDDMTFLEFANSQVNQLK